jgi:DNA-binding Lrp family transcriptional regulator
MLLSSPDIPYSRITLTIAEITHDERHGALYNGELLFGREANNRSPAPSLRFPTTKPLQILELLLQNGDRKTVYSVSVGQAELAKGLQITRQALSLHFKKLRESGLIQVGRGFINVTKEGLKAVGYRTDPVILNVRILPQKRSEAIQRIDELPATEIFRVTGDADVVLIVEQDRLDRILEALSHIDGVVETKSLVSIACHRSVT